MTVVIKPDPNEGNKFSVRGMHYTYGLHGIVLAVDYVSIVLTVLYNVSKLSKMYTV